MKKKILAVLLSGVMALSLIGCGGAADTKTEETKTEEAKTEASDEGTEASGDFQPEGDFNIRVPFAAGGAADTIARIMAQGLQKTYGKTAVVNNITGANGAIAANDLLAAKAAPTEMMVGGIAMFTLAPLFSKDINLNIDDFEFVTSLVAEDLVLFVNTDSGIKDFQGLMDYAKDNEITFGSNAPGGATHMLATMLFGEAGVDAQAVTSDGSAKDLLALAGGNVTCAIANASLGDQYIEEGKLTPIAVFSAEPFTGYEGIEVPTVQSLGYDIVFKTCNFLMTKAGVDKKNLEDIRNSIIAYSETDEFKELAKNANYHPVFDDAETVKKTIENTAAMCQKAYDTYYKK